MTEVVLEQSERPDGTVMQTVRLSDGSEIVREAPDEYTERMAKIEAAAKRAGWSQDEIGLWVHPDRPNSSFCDPITLCEALDLPSGEGEE